MADPRPWGRGVLDARFACLSCHKVDNQGGLIGGLWSQVERRQRPEPPSRLSNRFSRPGRTVKEGYVALTIATADGKVIQGYRQSETEKELVVREAATGQLVRLAKADIEDTRIQGTLMPEGLAASLSSDQRKDLIRFLIELGRSENPLARALTLPHHAHGPAAFPYDRAPLHPERWPNWQEPVNRERLYDFYAKEAEYFRRQPTVPSLLPQFPGLDGGVLGHLKATRARTPGSTTAGTDTDLGTVLSGVLHGCPPYPKGSASGSATAGKLSTCFNPHAGRSLCYEAVWQGGFLKFAPKCVHGILRWSPHGLKETPLSERVPNPSCRSSTTAFTEAVGRVGLSYRVGDNEMLDAPGSIDKGQFMRTVGPAEGHPLAHLPYGRGGNGRRSSRHAASSAANIPTPLTPSGSSFKNPGTPCFSLQVNDGIRDGTAFLCTYPGGCLEARGRVDESLKAACWRRVYWLNERLAGRAGKRQGRCPRPRSDHPAARPRRRRRDRTSTSV